MRYLVRMDTPTARLKKRAAEALRASMNAPDEERTQHLRDAAEAFVDSREYFWTSDGATDWRGRSYAYRRFVGEAYADSGLSREELPTVTAAVRYHIGNVLRERLSAEDLEAIGLRPEGPRERSVEKRTRQAEILSAVSGGPIEDPREALNALFLADRILSRIDPAALSALDAGDRARARKTAHETAETLAEVEKAAVARRRR